MFQITDIFSLSLNDITPQNIKSDPKISALIQAIDPEFKELSRLSLEPLILSRIDELDESVLDLLAWQMHADFYDLAGTIEMKREVVKNSILWHRHKGTEWAILEALRQIDIQAKFIPWWESGEAPYTFRLKAIVTGDFYRTKGKDSLQASIRRVVEESKSARSYMTDLKVNIDFKDNFALTAGIIPILSGEHRILLPKVEAPDRGIFYAGIGTGFFGEQRLLLAHEENLDSPIRVATIKNENRDISLGVDLDEMQELLERFERRILTRIDDYEKNILLTFELHQKEINQKLEDIKSMLQWKGADEEL